MRILSLMLALVCLCFPVADAVEAPYGPEVEQAYRDYIAGSEGDKKAAKRAAESLQALSEANPDDPFILMLFGGSQTLKGRDAWMPWKKMDLTEEGLATMAKSLRLLRPEHDDWQYDGLPVSVQVKSITGITFTQVPDFFGRFEQGYALLLEASNSPLLDTVPPQAHSYIHYYAALAAKKAEESDRQVQLLERLAAMPMDDEFTQAARDALAEAGD